MLRVRIFWLFLFIVAAAFSRLRADEGAEPANGRPDPFEWAGTVVAQGTNNAPAGALRLKTYRLERLTFPQPASLYVQGRAKAVRDVYRLTITGGPFPVGAMPLVLWVDDQPLLHVQEGGDSTEAATLLDDVSLLRPGAMLGVSYGEQGERSVLPERFSGVP